MPESSRRGFLIGTAATAAATVTGGVNAPMARAAGVGLVAAGGFLAKYKDLVEKIGKDGVQAIYQTVSASTPELTEEEGRSLRARVLGQAMWKVTQRSDGAERYGLSDDSIDFSQERMLTRVLKTLPRDMSIHDFTNEETVREIYADRLKHNPEHAEVAMRRIADFAKIVRPMCDSEQTTAGDLLEKCEAHFIRLARHAIKAPPDFGFSVRRNGENPNHVHISGSSSIGDLEILLGNSEEGRACLAELRQVRTSWEEKMLGHIRGIVEDERVSARAAEQAVRAARESEAREQMAKWAREAAERKLQALLNPDLRRKATIDLISAGEGCFIVRPASRESVIPTHAHWLEWQQAMTQSGEGITEEDISVGHNGLSVTFHDAVVRTHLEEKAAQNHGWVAVELPNRVEGVDLNPS